MIKPRFPHSPRVRIPVRDSRGTNSGPYRFPYIPPFGRLRRGRVAVVFSRHTSFRLMILHESAMVISKRFETTSKATVARCSVMAARGSSSYEIFTVDHPCNLHTIECKILRSHLTAFKLFVLYDIARFAFEIDPYSTENTSKYPDKPFQNPYVMECPPPSARTTSGG